MLVNALACTKHTPRLDTKEFNQSQALIPYNQSHTGQKLRMEKASGRVRILDQIRPNFGTMPDTVFLNRYCRTASGLGPK